MADCFRLEWSARPSLARHVEVVWAERSARRDPLLPDGVVELVWSGRGLFVRGADTCAHAVDAFPERTLAGVRFRPGAGAAVLGVHAAELVDARVGVSALWGRAEMERLEAALAACAAPETLAGVLESIVAARVREEPDAAVEGVVSALRAQPAPVRVAALAAQLGLSERQLLRRCRAALGYGPKTLDRILRFQRFLAAARARADLGLAGLAAAAGYADQPHLTRECVRLAGETPAALLARG